MRTDKPTNAWYLCSLLSALYFIANIDRFVINLMVEQIKRDFGVSDTQISLLIGITFSLFYVVCGFWVARLADRSSRRWILTVGALVWSAMTAACGLAQSYLQLFFARIGIGAGESVISPCGQSMIADTMEKRSLGKAISIFTLGSLFGSIFAFIVGGYLLSWAAAAFPEGVEIPLVGTVFNWQLVFFVVSVPGAILALVFFFTTRDPARGGADGAAQDMSLGDVWSFIRRHPRTYIGIYGGISCVHIGAAAATTWLPALSMRKFGLSPEEVGVFTATTFAIPGVVGALGAGVLADRQMKRGRDDSYFSLASLLLFLGFLPFGMAPLMPDLYALGVLCALGTVTGFAANPLSATALQTVSPGAMRSTAASLFTIAIAIVGYGLGPLLVALLTDYVFRDEQMLDRAMAIVIGSAFFAAALFFRQGRAELGRMMSAARPALA